MLNLAEEFPGLSKNAAPLELRVSMPREVLTAALYDSSLTFEDLGEWSDAEIRDFVLSAVLFQGVNKVGRIAERVSSNFAEQELTNAAAAWWSACAARVESAFFGTGPAPAARLAGVTQ